jgi:glutathione S-transferase
MVIEQVYLASRTPDNPFIHQFQTKNRDKGVENWLLSWISCGQRVENPLTALHERVKRIREKAKKFPALVLEEASVLWENEDF